MVGSVQPAMAQAWTTVPPGPTWPVISQSSWSAMTSWTATTQSPITQVRVMLDKGVVWTYSVPAPGQNGSSSWTINGLVQGHHSLGTQWDAYGSGNWSGPGGGDSSFWVDLNPPTGAINSINGGYTATINDTVALKTVELWMDEGNGSVRQADLYNGQSVSTALQTWSGALPKPVTCVNSVIYTVYADDWGGHRAVIGSVSVQTPDTDPPSILPSVKVYTGSKKVDLSAQIADASKVAQVVFTIDGVNQPVSQVPPYIVSANFAFGHHLFSVHAADCRGNSQTVSQSFDVVPSLGDPISGPSFFVGAGTPSSGPLVVLGDLPSNGPGSLLQVLNQPLSLPAGLTDLDRIRVGDLNGDGKDDFIYLPSSGGGPIQEYISSGDGRYSVVQGPWINVSNQSIATDLNRVRLADFNGDGRADLFVLSGSGITTSIKIYLANPDGTYGMPVSGPQIYAGVGFNGDVDVNRIKIGRFHSRGKEDIAILGPAGTTLPIQIYSMNSNGVFGIPTNGPTRTISNFSSIDAISDLNRIKVGDFNGDGVDDLLVVDGGGNAQINVYLSNHDGTFQPPIPGPLVSVNPLLGSPAKLADLAKIRVADFNGDGCSDIAVLNSTSLGSGWPIALYLSTPSGQFQPPIHGPNVILSDYLLDPMTGISRVRIGDFNGDGRADFMIQDGSGAYDGVEFYISDATSSSWSHYYGPKLYSSNSANLLKDNCRLVLGDFNGDKRTDVIQIQGEGTSQPIQTYFSFIP